MLEELGGEACVRTEQQGGLAVDDAGVQVWHRHRRRADGCLAVDLGLVLLDHFRVVATQPLAADREAAKAFALFDARLLQQRQGRATGAEEDEAGVDFTAAAAVDVLDADGPATAVTAQAGDPLAVLDLGIRRAGQVLEQLVGQGAEVDVGAFHDAGGGDFLVGRATRHHQRHPLAHQRFVFGVLHLGEGMVLFEQLEALLQEAHAFVTFDVAQVRHRVDERPWRAECAFLAQVGPELPGNLELGVDVHRFLDVDAAVGGLRRVVQFTQPGMAGPGVVPRVGTFRGTRIHQLDDFQLDCRVEFLEQYGQGGTHDACPYQYYIDCFVLRH
ncbi:hypothetical protein D3C77_374270 [compost metagenome]